MKAVESGKLRVESVFCVLAYICIFLFSGCERREITYYMESEIEIHVDWSKSELDESEANYGATAIFYPEAGGPPKVVLMGNREYEKTRLPRGRYNIIIFNRSFDDFSAIAFRGTDYHHTLEAYASRSETRGEEITGSPEKLAADCVEGFEVTEDMLGNYSDVAQKRTSSPDTGECSLCFTPRKLIEEMKVTVHVKGLNNMRSAVASIDGVAASVLLATGQTSQQTVTQLFELGNPEYYPDSPFNGTVTATFNAFNFNVDETHDVRMQAQLVDGKSTFEQEFTNVPIQKDADENGKIILVLEVGTEKLPDVKPEDSAGSGFDADVEDWGDEQEGNINI